MRSDEHQPMPHQMPDSGGKGRQDGPYGRPRLRSRRTPVQVPGAAPHSDTPTIGARPHPPPGSRDRGKPPPRRRHDPDPNRIPKSKIMDQAPRTAPDQHGPARPGLKQPITFGTHQCPQWTDGQRRLIYVSAGQPPLDVARPKALEPLTF